MACDNGLAYYIIGWVILSTFVTGTKFSNQFMVREVSVRCLKSFCHMNNRMSKGIATLASGMCIYWVGYIDFAAGGLHLEDYTPENKTCIELEERNAEIWEKPANCLKTVEQGIFFLSNLKPVPSLIFRIIFQLACNHDDVAFCNVCDPCRNCIQEVQRQKSCKNISFGISYYCYGIGLVCIWDGSCKYTSTMGWRTF